MPTIRSRVCVAVALLIGAWPGPVLAHASKADTVDSLLVELTHPHAAARQEALGKLEKLGDRTAIPALIELLRFAYAYDFNVSTVLEQLSGQKFGDDWGQWVEWLARHPEVGPHPSFLQWKSALFSTIDPAFVEFLHPGVKHRVRIEEIVWGGVAKDGIPALTNPRHIPASQAAYLRPEELVLGLSIKGQHRAYPLRIMDWHEMANDVIAGTPVTISY